MDKAIVITSIYMPTEAVAKLSMISEYKVIVVGDKKTPNNWNCPNVKFISIEEQFLIANRFGRILPFDHYSRKMIGYLYAIQNGAKVIVDTDDDNIPKESWGFPLFEGCFRKVQPDLGYINIYTKYTNQNIWPRGLPLDLIAKNISLPEGLGDFERIGVWQGLADEDPDVDAIYRLTCDKPCVFSEGDPIVLSSGTVSPFNSQNTAFREEMFPLLYLPAFVTFRFTDILRGIVAQPIMWNAGYSLGFINATVIQKRNPHDYMKDFISEIPMYKYSRKALELVTKAVKSNRSVLDNLADVYEELHKSNIVPAEELPVLDSWLLEMAKTPLI